MSSREESATAALWRLARPEVLYQDRPQIRVEERLGHDDPPHDLGRCVDDESWGRHRQGGCR
ncbi:hypothetical protein AB0D47_39115 [Streptomyces sp. NPDC048376]|uniref:hypothetical protein n=1 Tax=Streptomyces sp. NPDC048376 TaxID=3154926 RepID=UPI0034370AE9